MQKEKIKSYLSSGGAGALTSCFSVRVGELHFAVPVSDTHSIFRIDNVTPVPLGPTHISGLTNLRGRALTIVSLQARFSGNASRVSSGALAIALQHNGEDYALVVDEVGDVIEVDRSHCLPVPPHFTGEHARLTEALYRHGERLLSLLNVRELLDTTAQKS
jgi:purine-binding chemotaxis protein CheW